MFSDTKEAFAFLESFTNFEKKAFNLRFIRLDRMHRLLSFFGNPELTFKTIHVAGSKGKGSTSAFLASILKEAGHRPGLYTSPHLVSYKERITLAGDEIDDVFFLRGISALRDLLMRRGPEDFPGGEYPTTFELLTCLGFLIFRELGCDWAVLETGMGGRLDATNVVLPEASVLTPIELEHTEFLGETLAEIAGEKAGILKERRPVFVSAQSEEAMEVFRRQAAKLNCPFHCLDEALSDFSCRTTLAGTEMEFAWKNGTEPFGSETKRETVRLRASLRLLGEVQAENAALAALTIKTILPDLSGEVLKRGVELAFIPGRFQRIEERPDVYIDGSHTPYSVTRLIHSFLEIHKEPDTLILGIVAGKRHREIAEILCPRFRSVIVTTPGTFKPSDPKEVYDSCRRFNSDSRLVPDAREALAAAKRGLGSPEGPILVTGSFYMAGEILRLYENGTA